MLALTLQCLPDTQVQGMFQGVVLRYCFSISDTSIAWDLVRMAGSQALGCLRLWARISCCQAPWVTCGLGQGEALCPCAPVLEGPAAVLLLRPGCSRLSPAEVERAPLGGSSVKV